MKQLPPLLPAPPHKAGEYTFRGKIQRPGNSESLPIFCDEFRPARVELAGVVEGTGIAHLPLHWFEGEWRNADDSDLEISKDLSILQYYHCGKCLKELPEGVSPAQYAQYEVGATRVGMQVWCKRHNCNVVHMHFGGHRHVALLHAAAVPAERHDDIVDDLEDLLVTLRNAAGEDADVVRIAVANRVQQMLDNRQKASEEITGSLDEKVVAAKTDVELNAVILQTIHGELVQVNVESLAESGMEHLAGNIHRARNLVRHLLHPHA